MDWLGANAIAIAALTLSIVTAFIQISNWRTSRHKVTVDARSSTAGLGPGDAIRNHTYVTLTVRNTGRAISIMDVSFDRPDKPFEDQGAQWGNPPDGVPILIPFEPLPSFFTSGVLVPDGGSRSWVFSLSSLPFIRKPRDATRYVAKVELSNGKTVSSEPFWHNQSPAEGWLTSEYEY